MFRNDRASLWLALVVTTLLTIIVSVVLYLNEDLRQTTFALLEEVTNEEGEVVKKVKVEKPEPNREQVREIARNQELKKREKLKENARELRKTVIELEEAVAARKESLASPDAWDAFSLRIRALVDQTVNLRYWLGKSRYLNDYPNGRKDFDHLRDYYDQHASQVHVLSLQEVVTDAEGAQALLQAQQLLSTGMEPARETLRAAYQEASVRPVDRDQEKLMRYLDERVVELKKLIEDTEHYVSDFEAFLLNQAVVDVPEALIVPEDLSNPQKEIEPESTLSELSQLPSEAELESMETAELYETIQEMTERVDEAYAENQAAELAEMQQMSFDEAKEHVAPSKADTGPDLSESLKQNQPNNSEEFKAFNEALSQAERASESMKRHAESRLEKALGKESSREQATQTAEQLKSALSHQAAIKAEIAMEATNAGRDDGNLQDLRGLMDESYQTIQGTSGEEGGSSVRGVGRGATYDSESFLSSDRSLNNPSKIKLDSRRTYAQALPGRRFDMNSPRKGWIFIDTWYAIGPWELPRGKEFEEIFPPEIDVDLDASYIGKTHPVTKQPIELVWRFIQSETMRIKPPDEMSSSVYYAYTEVYCESRMDVVVAVASDDRAKLWINDLVVFQDVGLSGWSLDEGFRRVLLKPGYNTLLIRLENGPSFTNFSVLMCPFEALTL